MITIIFMLSIIGMTILVGCQTQTAETMVLLDEKITAVKISKSHGFGGMNENYIHFYTDVESLKTFENAITTAQIQMGKVDVTEPEYDVMVEYTSAEGQLPTHGIHLWLGKENEKSMFMYIGDDEVYLTTPKITEKLRTLILSGE